MVKIRYEDLNDEELLDRFRKKDGKARDVLSVRYFRMRRSLWESVLPEAFELIDEWEMNECFFNAYLAAEAGFEKEKDTKFLTFFCQILKYQALSTIRDYYRERHFRDAIPLDAEINSIEDEENPYFTDTVAGSVNEPVSFVNREEILAEVYNAPIPDIDNWKEAMLICFEGYGTVAASDITGQEAHSLRRRVKTAREHLRKWLKEQKKAAGNNDDEIIRFIEEGENDDEEQ